jgi:hypothetical protein
MQIVTKPRQYADRENRPLAQAIEVCPAAFPVELNYGTVKPPPLKLNDLHEIARWLEIRRAAAACENTSGLAARLQLPIQNQVGTGPTRDQHG